jgi:hypothetical protein
MMKKLNKTYAGVLRSKSAWLAILILAFGIVLFIAAMLRE